jgi:hypothetical protein
MNERFGKPKKFGPKVFPLRLLEKEWSDIIKA